MKGTTKVYRNDRKEGSFYIDVARLQLWAEGSKSVEAKNEFTQAQFVVLQLIHTEKIFYYPANFYKQPGLTSWFQ